MKNSILAILASLALAVPASAQLGRFPTAAQQGAGMYYQQCWQTRVNYACMTGYDGLAPSFQNPNSYYATNGLGVVPAWSTAYPYGGGGCGPAIYNGPVIVNAPVYPCPPPVYGGNGGWGVNIGVGFGGSW